MFSVHCRKYSLESPNYVVPVHASEGAVWFTGRRENRKPSTTARSLPMSIQGEGMQVSYRVIPKKPPKCLVSPTLASPSWCSYPKRNFRRYLTGPGLLRGGNGATFSFGGWGFFSGRVTVKASSGGWGCRNRGRKCVETCWGLARGLQPRLALPRLLSATYHSRPDRGLRCTAEA